MPSIAQPVSVDRSGKAPARMQIVRIVGASYSGSTALGYALNTVDSYFFGSETYRLLRSFQKRTERLKGQSSYPQCDMCGPDCAYWSHELIERVKAEQIDSLEAVYRLFELLNPDVSVYVDGSKQLRCYKSLEPGRNLVSVKHPMRMIASSAYNDRRAIGFASNGFADLRAEIAEAGDRFLTYAATYLARLADTYDRIFTRVPDGFVCKVDQMHVDGMSGFAALSRHLELGENRIFPIEFSKYPVHTLGGNRAPYWQALQTQQGKSVQNHRKAYYDTAESIGDWVLDNKYRIIFDELTLDAVRNMDQYARACRALGYAAQP